MAKVVKTKAGKRKREEDVFPLEKTNFIILGVGIATIVAGYLALSGDTVESFRQLTVAPLLLVLGYCVIIPVGLIYRKKKEVAAPPAGEPTVPQTP